MRSVAALVLAILALAILGPLLAPHDPRAIDIPNRLAEPSGEFWLGTDRFGRDLLSRILHGAKWSLGLAFAISLISLAIGTAIGLLAALGGKWIDWAIMRTTDTFPNRCVDHGICARNPWHFLLGLLGVWGSAPRA